MIVENESDLNREIEPTAVTLDLFAREQLSEAARWAKFLAIIGFVVCGLIGLLGIWLLLFSSLAKSYNYQGSMAFKRGTLIWVLYFFISVLYFFRCLFLYRFAIKMKSGLHFRNQEEVNASFNNLKKLYRYNAILTIGGIIIYVLLFLTAIFRLLHLI